MDPRRGRSRSGISQAKGTRPPHQGSALPGGQWSHRWAPLSPPTPILGGVRVGKTGISRARPLTNLDLPNPRKAGGTRAQFQGSRSPRKGPWTLIRKGLGMDRESHRFGAGRSLSDRCPVRGDISWRGRTKSTLDKVDKTPPRRGIGRKGVRYRENRRGEYINTEAAMLRRRGNC